MLDINKFYEKFLEELQLDVDFNPENNQFVAKTLDTTYSESVELPTLTQLLNSKSDEFMHVILLDVDAKFVIVIDNYEILHTNDENEVPSYELSVMLDTKVDLVDVNIIDEIFDTTELEIGSRERDIVRQFCKQYKFNRTNKQNKLGDITLNSPNETYEFKVNSIEMLNETLKNIVEMFNQFGTLATQNDEMIQNFNNFIKNKK
jgi:hypothetical protein